MPEFFLISKCALEKIYITRPFWALCILAGDCVVASERGFVDCSSFTCFDSESERHVAATSTTPVDDFHGNSLWIQNFTKVNLMARELMPAIPTIFLFR